MRLEVKIHLTAQLQTWDSGVLVINCQNTSKKRLSKGMSYDIKNISLFVLLQVLWRIKFCNTGYGLKKKTTGEPLIEQKLLIF